MKRKHKRKPMARRRFIIGWTLVWYLSLFLPGSFIALTRDSDFIPSPPMMIIFGVIVGLLAFFQIVLARRYLHTELRHWLFLALLGFIVGQIGLHFLQVNVDLPLPPWVIQSLNEPESAATFLRYALYRIAWDFLHWYVPLVFQWLALRRRFRHHGLWLMAAVLAAPLHFVVYEHGGILAHAVDLLEHLTGSSLANANPLILFLDSATPAIMMGLVLQYIAMKKDAP